MNNISLQITFILLSIMMIETSCNKKIVSATMIDQSNIDPKLYTKHELSSEYTKELELWRTNRYKSITSPQGWLSLIGLHWLQEGKNVLGSSPDSDIQLPHFMQDRVGTLTLDGDNVKFRPRGENFINSKDKAKPDGTLTHDGNGSPTVLSEGSLHMHIIKRGNKYGLRVKNSLAEARYQLEEIPNFSADASYIRTAKFVPALSNSDMDVNSIIGVDISYQIAGHLLFVFEDTLYKLVAFDGGPDYFFILIKDETAGDTSYGAGRFIDVKRPQQGSDYTLLDFNKAYNPPCAFSDYATCPLPPLENYLPFLVSAGEKNIKSH